MFCQPDLSRDHRPEDVYWNMRHNQMEYLYGDIMVAAITPVRPALLR